MPIYNEKKNIFKELYKWIKAFNLIGFKNYKFIIINDGSKDKSLIEIKRVKHRSISVYSFKNSGHGAACTRGYKLAIKKKFSWILQIDSDGQCDSKYLEKFLKLTKQNDCIFGNRVHRNDGTLRFLFSKILSLAIFFKKGIYVKDLNVPYRLIKSDLLKLCVNKISNKIILKNVQLSYLIRSRARIAYVPMTFLKRTYGSSKYNYRSLLKQLVNLIIHI